jgi:RNA polymerase sigma-70 factor (ECF subfamily)
VDVRLPLTPEGESDLDLMARVSRKDPAAERALMRRLSGRVGRLARLLSGTLVDADDAAQLSLLEILGSAGTFRIAASLVGWADRITVRTVRRLIRRELARKSLLARWVIPGELPWGRRSDVGVEPLGLDALLTRLSPERREALVLRHALEYSVEEIAELTGAPIGTVKDRLVAARKEIRSALEREAARAARGRSS